MLEAMHRFNAQQHEIDPSKDNFLYVQNIGTNRHTRDLGYRVDRSPLTGSVELDDITLSAEMAMLHTLEENSAFLSKEVKEALNEINKKILAGYKFYLNDPNREKYFAESDAGLSVISDIRDFKKDLAQELEKQKKKSLPMIYPNWHPMHLYE